MMKFLLNADRDMTVVFEPTAEEYALSPGETITVQWYGPGEDGMVSMENGDFVVHAPTAGHSRAWRSDGVEIYLGPDSGPDAQ
ncbi:hypothetical protein AB0M39_32270 [Streptomyces sp. NPDC051907]|uniref:hypothetical protein n=1 Tax=Streptomyces sp. NPDC051907 TaxID=3155284 RepID=UPI003436A247